MPPEGIVNTNQPRPPPTNSPTGVYNQPGYSTAGKKTPPKIFIIAGVVIVAVVLLFLALKLFIKAKPTSANLTWWGLWEDSSIVTPIISAYETEHPNVKITYVRQSQQDYRERLKRVPWPILRKLVRIFLPFIIPGRSSHILIVYRFSHEPVRVCKNFLSHCFVRPCFRKQYRRYSVGVRRPHTLYKRRHF